MKQYPHSVIGSKNIYTGEKFSLRIVNAKNQNNQLYDDYEIASLPTVIVLDSDREIYREAGYGRGTPKDYVAVLKSLFPEKM